ncbi:TIGR03571 family LLM class oxidoreductase [Brevundimonas sp.]|jgi:luciferase-type oxidoreductase|uniref:TIGR03571 family LLM class oxidoreductase n=1 Tax=Brevundimonas sp. TaxID=1871086 RepID=UPI0037BFF642
MVQNSSIAARLFRPDQMSLGLALPLRTVASGEVDLRRQVEIAGLAEAAGFDALWVRDVPLNGDWYPEDFGHPDPFVMLGALTAKTRTIALGTAATVLTLRHPLHVAKAAVSLDRLSGGRFVLGLGSGDRPEEFAAFDVPRDQGRERFRDHWARLASALAHPQRLDGEGDPEVAYALRPPPLTEMPLIAIGSSGQTLEWIARNAQGWATYHRPPEVQRDRHALWRRAVERHAPDRFRSFTVAMGVDLSPDADAPAEPVPLGLRAGARALVEELHRMRSAGVHHLILNLPPGEMTVERRLEILSRHVIEEWART